MMLRPSGSPGELAAKFLPLDRREPGTPTSSCPHLHGPPTTGRAVIVIDQAGVITGAFSTGSRCPGSFPRRVRPSVPARAVV
jgi:hypothetical protein